jgi:hypothetical protein
LRTLVQSKEEYAKGFGIPFGGAMIYHADMSMEAVRYPVAEFEKSVKQNGSVTGNLLLPPDHDASVRRTDPAGSDVLTLENRG